MKKKIWQRVAAVSMSALIAVSSIPLSGSTAYAADNINNLTLSDVGTNIVINSDGNYYITGTTNRHTITVNDGVTATITLDGVGISSSASAPIDIGKSANVTIKLLEKNQLTVERESGNYNRLAALQISPNADVTITSYAGDNSTEGELIADASVSFAPAIGSNASSDYGNITINGGTITAIGNEGPGIGGSYYINTYYTSHTLNRGKIYINGGSVTAKSQESAAIGGTVFDYNDPGKLNEMGIGCGLIQINGGTIHATGATGIGAPYQAGGIYTSASDIINISGGNIIASGRNIGIGGNYGGYINISGGNINAATSNNNDGGRHYCAIGQVLRCDSDSLSATNKTAPISINITGGSIVAAASNYAYGIGSATGSSKLTLQNCALFSGPLADTEYNKIGSKTSGLIFDNCTFDSDGNITGGTGQTFGSPIIGTNFTIPTACTLSNPATGKVVTLSSGVTMTNNGTLKNNGTIYNYGTILNNGRINNLRNDDGTVGRIINKDNGKVQSILTLHRNDGTSTILTGTYTATSGQKYDSALPMDLTRSGWVLVGWNTAADGSGNAATADSVFDGNNTELYAQWEQVGKINAKVTDSDNGQPVSGAVIATTNESSTEIGQATTGADGTALLTLKPGIYTATVKTPATGYAASASVTGLSVEIGKTISANFTARPFKGSAAITHLDTKRNKLVAIAPISITDKNGKVVYTGSSTSTSLTVPSLRIPDAPFTVKETSALAAYRSDAAAYTANLTADGQTSSVEMHSVPMMGDITYTATDKDGKPIVGATVNLVDKDGNVVATGTTDSNGKVTFKDVFAGDYTVQLPGYENGNVAVTVKDQQNTAPAPVKAAMLIGALEITHVDAQSNKALPVTKVQLKDKSGKEVFSGAPADNSTSLTIPNLTGPASPYTLTEETPITNYHANTTQYPVSITTQGQEVKVVMKSSQYAGDVTLHITDPTTGKPAANVKVNLIDKDGNITATDKTDKDGNVTFTNVPIGTYTYAVDDPRFKLDGDKTKSVTVTDGSKQTASIPVISLGNVTLHITDPSTGKPASGVTVNLIDKDGKVVATGKTDKNGNVTFSGIPAGDYTYKVDDPRFVSITGKVTIGTGNTAGTIDIEVKHPASSPTVSKTGSANITATDNSGKPLANVPVIIKDSTGKTVGTGTTDSDGKVTVPNLPDGTYTVSSGDSSVSLEGSITITNGQTSSVTLKGSRVPTGNAKLLVVDTHQQPLKNFTLLVMRVDSPAANSSMIPLRKSGTIVNSVSSENNQVVAEVTTDANGYVILPQLDAGQYILIAKDSSEYKVDSSLAIVPSTTVSATVTATPISTSSSKQPAASASTVSGSGTKAPAASNNNQPTAETPVESSASVPSDYTVPKTGQSGIIPVIVLVLMAVCGTAGVLFSRKKRK